MCSGTEQKLVSGEVPLFPFRTTKMEIAMCDLSDPIY